MEQIKSEIRRAKKERSLWEKDTHNWNSGMKVEELTNKIKQLEDKLYDMEYAELEALEKQEGLQG
ncbi:hypothetical protein [Clostridium sp.]|uniref:hypothetical protein n=1 Tax=Clostridium sp. TaxID=1506 RepID=UPI003F2F05C5